MQDNSDKIIYIKKVLGNVFKVARTSNTNLSCNKAEAECSIGRGNLNRLENGKTDPSFTTLWKAAEASDKKLSEIIRIIEETVGEDFTLID